MKKNMNYFVNENIFTLNSGTEFSAAKRLQLFKNHGLPAKLLTKNYNSQLAQDAARLNIEMSDILNMYNYFQETLDVPSQDIDVRYIEAIDKSYYHIESLNPNESVIKYHGKIIGKVLIAPATVGLVGAIEYYTDHLEIMSKDLWDRRGFKSCTQYFLPDGNLGTEVFYDLQGQPKLEISHMNINNELHPTLYRLIDYKGKSYVFSTEEELFLFFLNEVAAQENAVFINDRISLAPTLIQVQGAAGKWQYLHESHSPNQIPGTPVQVQDYLRPLFTSFIPFLDGIIVPTQQQKTEINKAFRFKRVLALPDTFSEYIDKIPHQLSERKRNEIIVLGRLAEERGVMDLVEIFTQIKLQKPEAELVFYGYPSPANMENLLKEAFKQVGMSQFDVHFKGYQSSSELAELLKQAALVINPAHAESFGIATLQAMSYGVPVVAYKVKYGTRELIEHKKNGWIVPLGEVEQFADAVVTLLSDDEQWTAYSQAAYEKAQTFNEEQAWQKWEETQITAENLFVKEVNL